MTKISNTSDTRQPVHTRKGVVFVGPGRVRDLELTPEGEKFVKASSVLEILTKPARKAAKASQEQPEEVGEA